MIIMAGSVLLLISFLAFMLFFAGVGLASMRVKEDTTDDYLVAGRGMHPALAALSAVSTWNSGYMFIGFIGFIFINGYSAVWIALVSTIGQLVAWIWLYKYIQKEGEARGIRSLSSLVSNTTGSPEAKVAAVLSVIFLSIYAAAQLTAGGIALETMLKWSPTIGILIGFVLVVAYCYAGGIRASIWTDAAQSCVMIVGSTILCYVAVKSTGGFSGLHEQLKGIEPAMVNLFPSDLKFGATLWIAAFFLGGLGVAGQPQVVSRVMTLKDDKARKQAMVWFFVWQTPFILLMFFIGLACRVLLPELGASGAETGLPKLAMEQLSPLLGGLILASIFAATMSTADSQVLACTAAITDDIKPEWSQDHKTTKKVTLAVAAFATVISLFGQQLPGFGDSVFTLVVLAVYGLGGIFVPLLLVRMAGYEPDSKHSIAMMMSAMIGVIVWTVLGFGEDVFPSVPGVGAAFATHFLLCAFRDSSAKNPFGRYAIPAQKTLGIGAAVTLLLAASIEASYHVLAPDSSESSEPAFDSMWNLTVEFETHFEEQVIDINDGSTESFQFDIPADAVGVSFMLNYSESNEGGIGSQCDDVESSYDDTDVPSEFRVMWNLQNITGQNCGENMLGGIATWSGFLQTDTYENHQITIAELTVEKDAGEIVFDVKVDVNLAFPLNGDDGEEITLMMRYNTLVSYDLTEVE